MACNPTIPRILRRATPQDPPVQIASPVHTTQPAAGFSKWCDAAGAGARTGLPAACATACRGHNRRPWDAWWRMPVDAQHGASGGGGDWRVGRGGGR
jgi:hypothetical protein